MLSCRMVLGFAGDRKAEEKQVPLSLILTPLLSVGLLDVAALR